jgi:hypothetical protein
MVHEQSHLSRSDVRNLEISSGVGRVALGIFQREWLPHCMEDEILSGTSFSQQARYYHVRPTNSERVLIIHEEYGVIGSAASGCVRVRAYQWTNSRERLPGKL